MRFYDILGTPAGRFEVEDLASPITLTAVVGILIIVFLGIHAYWDTRKAARPNTSVTPDTKSQPAPKLKIHSAFYGAGNPDDVDLTNMLNRMIPRDGLAVMVNNNLIPGIPDPAPNVPKELKLHYSFGGPDAIPMVVQENSLLVLPRDFEYARQQGIAYGEQHMEELTALRKEHAKRLALEEQVRKSSEAELRRELDKANARAQQELIKSVSLEAQYLVDELEKLKDMNEKENSEHQVDLLYPIKGDQFGDRSTWRWQHEYLLRWKVTYDRLCVHCIRLKLAFGLWPLGSAVTYSKLIRRLSDTGKGLFPIDSSTNGL